MRTTSSTIPKTNSLLRKPRNQYALSVLNRFISNVDVFDKQINSSDVNLDESDHFFLLTFVQSLKIKRLLMLTDCLVGPESKPIVQCLRPTEKDLCDSLRILSELWIVLEDFVMQTPECERPEAHELYDLLADLHIRELLVAYDDIANQRYKVEDLDLVPIYNENDENSDTDSPGHLASGASVNDSTTTTVLSDKQSMNNGQDISKYTRPKKPHKSSMNNNTSNNGKSKVIQLTHQFEKQRQDPSPPLNQQNKQFNESSQQRKHTSDKPDIEEQIPTAHKNVKGPTHPSKHTGKQANKTLSCRQSELDSQRSPKSPRMSISSVFDSSPTVTKSLPMDRPKRKGKSSDQTSPGNSAPDRHNRHPRSSHDSHQTLQHTPKVDSQGHPASNTRKPMQSIERTKLPTPGMPRYVNLRRDHAGEDLGLTIAARTPSPPDDVEKTEPQSSNQNELAIQRILVGSIADRNGQLYPGDVLLEINGIRVHNLEEVFTQIRRSSNLLECTLLVQAPRHGLIPFSVHNTSSLSKTKRYIRCLFEYDATKDTLLPSGNIGLSFTTGDVLELLNDQDPNWWQVRSLNDPNAKTRLIPSQTLEERRQAFNQEKLQVNSSIRKSKRAIKTFFRAADSSGLRLRSDLWCYEEVVPWPQSVIPCLLLIGPTGVGRRTLKVLLAKREPKRFAYPMSDTTDPVAPTNLFRIVPKEQMESDVRSGGYVEWGKVGNHMYGIRFTEIRRIIASGRTAVLDCLPQSVHLLHQPEFNACAIFVAAPSFEMAKLMLQEGLNTNLTKNSKSDDELRSMIEQSDSLSIRYRHLYSHLLINKNMDESVDKMSRLINKLQKQPCWIPCGWAYELSIPHRSTDGTPFIPGSSSLSALGIHNLPPSSRSSVLARSILSGVSEESAESASRLARPPSICSGSVGTPLITWNRVGRLYEKRRRPHNDFQRHSPATISEHDTLSESGSAQDRDTNHSSGRVSKETIYKSKTVTHQSGKSPISMRNKHDKKVSDQSTILTNDSEEGMKFQQINRNLSNKKQILPPQSEIPNLVVDSGTDDADFSSTSTENEDAHTVVSS